MIVIVTSSVTTTLFFYYGVHPRLWVQERRLGSHSPSQYLEFSKWFLTNYLFTNFSSAWKLFVPVKLDNALIDFTEMAYMSNYSSKRLNSELNKKVILRERKRHTTRRVASARYAALSNGVPHPVLARGDTPSSPGQGVPHPVLGGWGYPIPGSGVWGVPHPVLAGGGTSSQVQVGEGGTPSSPGWGDGTPSSSGQGRGAYPRVKSLLGVPGVSPIQTWDGVPHQLDGVSPIQMCDGVPPVSWMRYPPDLGWGTPPSRPVMGYPLPSA